MIEEYEKKINYLYYLNRNLSSSIGSFNTLRGQLAGIVSKLEKENTKLETLVKNIGSYYTVDGLAIGDKISDNEDDIDSVISFINGIISGVDTKVSDIKKQIDSNNNSIWWYEKKLKELKG